MGLVHQFAIIPKDSDVSMVSSDMDSVSISDMIIQYIGDSLKWISTTWNGKRLQNGISYYGFSFIEDGEITKLKNILKQWVELFRVPPAAGLSPPARPMPWRRWRNTGRGRGAFSPCAVSSNVSPSTSRFPLSTIRSRKGLKLNLEARKWILHRLSSPPLCGC